MLGTRNDYLMTRYLMTELDVLPHTLRPLQPGEAQVSAVLAHATRVVPDAGADVPGGHAGGGHVLGVRLLLPLEGLLTPG